jgi:hypothetical protein
MTTEQLKAQIKARVDQIEDPRLLYALEALTSRLNMKADNPEDAMQSDESQIYGDAIIPASSEVSSHYYKPNLNSEGDKAA